MSTKRWDKQNKEKMEANLKTQLMRSVKDQKSNDEIRKDLEDREQIIMLKEVELIEKEKLLEERIKEVNIRENMLAAREAELQAKELAYSQKSDRLTEEEENLLADQEVASIMSAPAKRKRRRRLESERLGVPQRLTPEASLDLVVSARLTKRQILQINKSSPNFLSSDNTIRKLKQDILTDSGYNDATEITVNGRIIRVLSLAKVLIWRLNNIGIENLPEVVQFTFSGDGGGDKKDGDKSVKIGGFISNVRHSQADNNFICLAIVDTSESYDVMKAIMKAIFKDLELLNNLKIDGISILIEHFFVADLKFTSICFGHQGSSSTYYCIWCYSTLQNPSERVAFRSLNEIISAGENAEQYLLTCGEDDPKFKTFCRSNFSISHKPLMSHIQLTHVAPPALHILTGVVNYILKKAKIVDSDRVKKLLNECNINLENQKGQSKDLTGGDVRKILKLYGNGDISYEGYGHEIFPFMVKIQKYGECRQFDDDEIHALDVILEDLRTLVHTSYSEFFRSHKLHVLLDHVLPFIRLHKSWMVFGEQVVERSHQDVKRLAMKMKNGDKLDFAHKEKIVATSIYDRKVNF